MGNTCNRLIGGVGGVVRDGCHCVEVVMAAAGTGRRVVRKVLGVLTASDNSLLPRTHSLVSSCSHGSVCVPRKPTYQTSLVALFGA